MNQVRAVLFGLFLVVGICVLTGAAFTGRSTSQGKIRLVVTYSSELSKDSVDGRLLLLLSNDDNEEPRFQISDVSLRTQQVFGIDVEGWKSGQEASFDGSVLGYPMESLDEIPPGTYTIQALLHKYETFRRGDGYTLKLPMDRGEGQQWNRAPGNLFSKPRKISIGPGRQETVHIALDQVIPPISDPPETKYVKHVKILSERLSRFWGRPMYLGAHILLPEGFDEHPQARYPLIINHGHFTYTFEGFRENPPNPDLKPDFSERFQLAGYNRIQEETAYQLYKDWTSPGFP